MKKSRGVVGAVGMCAIIAGSVAAPSWAADQKFTAPGVGQVIDCRGKQLLVQSGSYSYVYNETIDRYGVVHRVENVSSNDLTLVETVTTWDPISNSYVTSYGGTFYGKISTNTNRDVYPGGSTLGKMTYNWSFKAANGTLLGTYKGKWDLAAGDIADWSDLTGTCNP